MKNKLYYLFILFLICNIFLTSYNVKNIHAEDELFLPVIMYHSIYPSRNNAYVLSPTKFEQDLQYIVSNNFNSVFASEVGDFINGKGELPLKPIMITFDDGYYNNLTKALPLLEKYKVKAVINLVGEFCDKDEKQHEFYSCLTWRQVELMSKSPFIEFQNHSYNLHNIKVSNKGIRQCWNENKTIYGERLITDIDKCSKKIEELSAKKPNCFAFPFGIYNDLSVEVLKTNNYNVLLTCNEKPNFINKTQKFAILNRYNRACWFSTNDFFDRLLKTK